MTDKAPQTAEAAADPGIDLEQELNALLGQIESANAAAAADGDAAPRSAAEADALDAKVAQLAAPDGADDTADEVLAGDFDTAEQAISQGDDPLADQIQELLDEAKTKSHAKPGANDGASIGELDQMLAAGADDAVAGEFESLDEVMGAAPPASVIAAANDGREALETNAEDAFASPEEVMKESSSDAAGDAQDVDADAYATVEQVAQDQTPAPAPVAAVKTKLESGPAPIEQEDAPAEPPDRPKRDLQIVLRVNGERLRRTCARINRPLGKYSPDIRNTIGYVGLATLANAVVLILYGLVF